MTRRTPEPWRYWLAAVVSVAAVFSWWFIWRTPQGLYFLMMVLAVTIGSPLAYWLRSRPNR